MAGLPTLSLEAQIHALRAIIDERDERYKIQFLTLRDAAELNNKAVSIAMDAADKAVLKAESAVEKRFESVNEFRAQMGDMQATFARTDLVNSRFTTMEKKIDEISEFRAGALARRTGFSDIWGWVVAAVGIGVAVLTFLLK